MVKDSVNVRFDRVRDYSFVMVSLRIGWFVGVAHDCQARIFGPLMLLGFSMVESIFLRSRTVRTYMIIGTFAMSLADLHSNINRMSAK